MHNDEIKFSETINLVLDTEMQILCINRERPAEYTTHDIRFVWNLTECTRTTLVAD